MLKRFISDMKKYNKYALTAARAELKSEVVNSYLNWLWWIISPLSFMTIYILIYGYVFNAKEPYFAAFIFIGITLWDFFSRMLNVSIKLVKNNKQIVSKIYIPKFILLVQKMYVNGFKLIISLGLVLILMIIYGVPITLNYLYFIPLMFLLILFTFGCSALLLHFGVFIEDLSNAIAIFLKCLFYFTGIFYNVAKRMPKPWGDIIIDTNPVALVMDNMRNALLYNISPNVMALGLWTIASIGICIWGIKIIYKNENTYVKII